MQLIKPNWAAPAHIHAYSTTRLGGVSQPPFHGLNVGLHVEDNPKHVTENRTLLAQHFPHAPDFCWLNQTHSNQFIQLSKNTPQAINADASWIDSGQRTCVVMTADCLPVLVTDQQGSFVAAIHAGWRGLYEGIVEKTIAHICTQLGLSSEQLLVWLGPCIGPTAFEVGDDVRSRFIQQNPLTASAFVTAEKSGKWLANLHQLAQCRLAHLKGISVTMSEHCTFSEPSLFYSYRRDGKTGRLATFIWIDERND